MELKVSDKKEKTKLALVAAVVGFALAFISAPFLLNQVYGSVESEVLYPQAFDENGDKLDYNDCPGYDDGIDPSQYDTMSIEELGQITDNVDIRIAQLQLMGILSEEEQEELDCLSAIRAVENRALERMGEIANDISELTNLYSDQIELNERWDSLSSKYDN